MTRLPSKPADDSAPGRAVDANRICTTSPPPKRLLVRAVNWLGDAVMTTPALQRIREAFPCTHITLLTHPKLEALWSGQPFIDAVITFQPREGLWHTARRLRRQDYDVGLALPNSHRSALELWLAGIPRRVGLRAPARSWLFTDPVARRPGAVRMRKKKPRNVRRLFAAGALPDPEPPPTAHQIHDYLHLAAALGANPNPISPRLEVDETILRRVRSDFKLEPGVAWLGLNPGAEYGPAKRWPAGHFAAAAAEVQLQTGCRCLILGGRADQELATQIECAIAKCLRASGNQPPPVNLAGRTTLQQLCAALKCCRAVVTNDTGPMHVAAALGIPVVVPFGSTSPQLTGPGLPGDPRHRLLRHPLSCSPCFLRDCPLEHQCLRSIQVQEVTAAIREAGGWA